MRWACSSGFNGGLKRFWIGAAVWMIHAARNMVVENEIGETVRCACALRRDL
jgi:hypothetical protein